MALPPPKAPALIVLHVDGRVDVRHAPGVVTFADLRSYIGAPCQFVDVVRLADGLDMWVDDEGLCNGQPHNAVASLLATHYRGYVHLHGPAVLAGVTPEGETVGLTRPQMNGVLVALLTIASNA